MKILVLGAGKMGYAVAFDLIRSPRIEQVIVADSNQEQLDRLQSLLVDDKLKVTKQDIADHPELVKLMMGCDIAISCVPYFHNYLLAKAALEAKISFCDLGGNEQIVEKEFLLHETAKERNITLIPDLGLAPGLVSILTVAAAQAFQEIYEIQVRVGGVPVEPEGLLMNYSQVFAIDGLINEYAEEVTVIRNGELKKVSALTELETIEFPRPFKMMEAFTTSGGISTLPQTFLGRVQHLDYKTIRYPGHCAQVKLLRNLGLMSHEPENLAGVEVKPRDLLTRLLQKSLKTDEPDAVLVRVTVNGIKRREPVEAVWECIDYADQANQLSAMMRMTAFPASIVAQMIARGDISTRGVLKQEDCVPVKLFLAELSSRGINFAISERVPSVVHLAE